MLKKNWNQTRIFSN